MTLTYTYGKIKTIAKEVKKTYAISSLPEIVQYVFSDDEVFSEFIRVGADLKTTSEADTLIDTEMGNGVDLFDLQKEVIKALVNANFYKRELQAMLKALEQEEQ